MPDRVVNRKNLKKMALYCVRCKNWILPEMHECDDIFVFECCAICDGFIINMKTHLCRFKNGPKWLPMHLW